MLVKSREIRSTAFLIGYELFYQRKSTYQRKILDEGDVIKFSRYLLSSVHLRKVKESSFRSVWFSFQVMEMLGAMERWKDSSKLKRHKTKFPWFVYYLGNANMTFPTLSHSHFMDISRAIDLVLRAKVN